MSQPNRLAEGGLIDRGRPLRFSFDGRSYAGYAGDTLASALLANGVVMVARSFKYHRPRGIVAAGPEDPAGLVELGDDAATNDPNVRVAEQEIFDGLAARPQHCWPSLRHDVGALNGLFAFMTPAGFYYKTFMGPPGSWMTFEPFIRRAAGLGRAPTAPDAARYESVNRHCDVLVVGAGPAGLMAALAAARAGARVILCEATPHLGGRLRDASGLRIDQAPAGEWVAAAALELARHDDARVLTRTMAAGYYADNFLALLERVNDHLPPPARDAANSKHRGVRQRLWRVRARQVVLATGALERPLVFHHNDRPGIVLAAAAQTWLGRYGVRAGRRAALFAGHDAAWRAAFDMHDAGADISAIVDLRSAPGADVRAEAARRGVRVFAGASVVDTHGRRRVSAIVVRRRDDSGGVAGPRTVIACDLLLSSGGWSPNAALFSQSRGKLRYDPDLMAYRPGQSWQAERSAGAANGTFGVSEAMDEGARAGAAAASDAGFAAQPAAAPTIEGAGPSPLRPAKFWVAPGAKPEKSFVDLHNDVTVRDLRLAVREGYRSVEHAKRYTTVGMGADQGKTATMNAIGILADAMGKTPPELGVTTFRQPYHPVTFGALAGQHVGDDFHARRTTPMHAWHAANGAVFEPVGDWLRARAYPQAGESLGDAVQREALAARRGVAALDASTLGKIDVIGGDAAAFLNRVYTGRFDTLKVGRCRYGLMLGEDGMLADDGVTARLADDHFHMTTTTGGAARVLTTLEDYLQTEWPHLEVYLTSVTEHWAVVALSGPGSAAVMADLCDDLDPDPRAFRFMHWRDAHIDGVAARVFRVSFTGELSYEINVPASYGRWLWERVIATGAAGAGADITPYGTDAMHLLRAEKGFVIVGQETDGTVTPFDLRLDRMVDLEKGDFIGRRSLFRPDTQRDDRKQLVGLRAKNPRTVLEEGAHIIDTASEPPPPVPALGHVTSSYFSPNLGRSIALALVERGGARMGETVYVTWNGAPPAPARIVATDFLGAAAEGAP